MNSADLRRKADDAVAAGSSVVSDPVYWRLTTAQLYALANLADSDDTDLRNKVNSFLNTMGVN